MGQGKEAIEEIGQSAINLKDTIFFILKGQVDWHEIALQINKAGIGSIFIVSITALFIGLAMSTQLAQELARRFNAENLVGGLIAVAIVRELAPVITSIVVAGRVGAAITAEIGSMKVTDQIDALQVLGIDPIRYLLVSRLIASSIVTPLLTVLAALVAILGGMVLASYSVNLQPSVYLDSVRTFLAVKDVMIMMLKSAIFGCIIAVIATTSGLSVKGGAEAVGNGATQTVVWCIILIFTFNYIVTSMFFGQ